MKLLNIKPTINKNNGQMNFNLPKKKFPKDIRLKLKQNPTPTFKFKFEGIE